MFVSQCFSFKIAEKSEEANEAEWQNQLQLRYKQNYFGDVIALSFSGANTKF